MALLPLTVTDALFDCVKCHNAKLPVAVMTNVITIAKIPSGMPKNLRFNVYAPLLSGAHTRTNSIQLLRY